MNTSNRPPYLSDSSIEFVQVDAPSKEGSELYTQFSGQITNISSMFWARKRIKRNGMVALKFGFSESIRVNKYSQISVSITETDDEGIPRFSEIKMSVLNIVPTADGAVIVRFSIDWTTPVDAMLNFIIVN